MKIDFAPSRLSGAVTAPPSKSIAHRLLLCAGLAEGESVVENISLSEDITATLRCLEAFGVRSKREGNAVRLISGGLPSGPVAEVLPCGACGTTLRFFLPLCMLIPGITVLTGTPRLLQRPLSVYEEICSRLGIRFYNDGKTVTVGDGLKGGRYEIPGNISSQFICGLLYALPFTEGDSQIILTESVESRPYIDLTLDTLQKFGVCAAWSDERTLRVPGGQKYSPARALNEGDWSNAAYWFALQSLGEEIDVAGLLLRSLQGDRVCVSLLRRLREDHAQIDLSNCPDLGPVLMAAAAAGGKGAVFTGTRRLRLKESDRGAVMAEELRKFGIETQTDENRIVVLAGKISKPAAPVFAHDDHRVAMALSCLLLFVGGTLTGAESVSKSYPDFFTQLDRLGAKMTISEE